MKLKDAGRGELILGWGMVLDEYLQSELDVTRCSYKLLASNIFVAHTDYVRRQMVYGLLQVRISFSPSFFLVDGGDLVY